MNFSEMSKMQMDTKLKLSPARRTLMMSVVAIFSLVQQTSAAGITFDDFRKYSQQYLNLYINYLTGAPFNERPQDRGDIEASVNDLVLQREKIEETIVRLRDEYDRLEYESGLTEDEIRREASYQRAIAENQFHLFRSIKEARRVLLSLGDGENDREDGLKRRHNGRRVDDDRDDDSFDGQFWRRDRWDRRDFGNRLERVMRIALITIEDIDDFLEMAPRRERRIRSELDVLRRQLTQVLNNPTYQAWNLALANKRVEFRNSTVALNSARTKLAQISEDQSPRGQARLNGEINDLSQKINSDTNALAVSRRNLLAAQARLADIQRTAPKTKAGQTLVEAQKTLDQLKKQSRGIELEIAKLEEKAIDLNGTTPAERQEIQKRLKLLYVDFNVLKPKIIALDSELRQIGKEHLAREKAATDEINSLSALIKSTETNIAKNNSTLKARQSYKQALPALVNTAQTEVNTLAATSQTLGREISKLESDIRVYEQTNRIADKSTHISDRESKLNQIVALTRDLVRVRRDLVSTYNTVEAYSRDLSELIRQREDRERHDDQTRIQKRSHILGQISAHQDQISDINRKIAELERGYNSGGSPTGSSLVEVRNLEESMLYFYNGGISDR